MSALSGYLKCTENVMDTLNGNFIGFNGNYNGVDWYVMYSVCGISGAWEPIEHN